MARFGLLVCSTARRVIGIPIASPCGGSIADPVTMGYRRHYYKNMTDTDPIVAASPAAGTGGPGAITGLDN